MATAHHHERSTMQTPEDQTHPDVSPAATGRRARLLAAAGVVVALAAAAGIAYAANSTKPEAKVAELALTGSASPDQLKRVRCHTKMQAYGPRWSQHRPRVVDEYVRAVARPA